MVSVLGSMKIHMLEAEIWGFPYWEQYARGWNWRFPYWLVHNLCIGSSDTWVLFLNGGELLLRHLKYVGFFRKTIYPSNLRFCLFQSLGQWKPPNLWRGRVCLISKELHFSPEVEHIKNPSFHSLGCLELLSQVSKLRFLLKKFSFLFVGQSRIRRPQFQIKFVCFLLFF